MLARLLAHLQPRRSSAFLLEREDDRILADIGLTRADIDALNARYDLDDARARIARFHSLPVPRAFGAPAQA